MGGALELSNISKVYPGTTALKSVNLEVKKGEIHGLIGKNGAGKSTLVGTISGIVTPTAGEITVGNKKYSTLTRILSKKEGICIVPQEPQIVLDATVAENMFMPDYPGTKGKIDWKAMYERADEILKKADLRFNSKEMARNLTISEQQLILVFKACYLEDAKVVILDEASASLSQTDQQIFFKIVTDCKARGASILYISHRTDEILMLCDRVTVLRDGETVGTSECCDASVEKLSAMIAGGDFHFSKYDMTPKKFTEKDVLLSVEHFTRYGVLDDVSFKLHKGEILGIAGLRGAGRTEILKGICGIEPPDEGNIIYKGKKKRFTSAADAMKNGIAYLAEDREHEGIISSASIMHNLSLNSLRKFPRFYISSKQEKKYAENLVQKYSIKIASLDQKVSQLSGGNKQKVAVARIASGEPEIYLLDEPTRGVDIAAKDSILNIIREKLEPSAGVIITAPALEDMILICDRILVLFDGKITKEYKRGEVDEKELFVAVQGQ